MIAQEHTSSLSVEKLLGLEISKGPRIIRVLSSGSIHTFLTYDSSSDFDKYFIGTSLVDRKNPYKYLFFSHADRNESGDSVYCYLALNLSFEPKRKLFRFKIRRIVFYRSLRKVINFHLKQNYALFVKLYLYVVDLNGVTFVFSVSDFFDQIRQPYNNLQNQIIHESKNYLTADFVKYDIHIKVII